MLVMLCVLNKAKRDLESQLKYSMDICVTNEQLISEIFILKKVDVYGVPSEPCNALARSHPQLLHLKHLSATFVCVTSESTYLPPVRMIEFVITNSLCW